MSYDAISAMHHQLSSKPQKVMDDEQTLEQAMEEYFSMLMLSKILPLPEWYNDL
jgi:hypothetical protein